jgi:hypothetical protein
MTASLGSGSAPKIRLRSSIRYCYANAMPMQAASYSCRIFGLFSLASALSAAPFLVGDRPYHCGSDHRRESNFTMNFVEFKDNGKPHCSEQLAHALEQIDRARSDNESVVVLAYIHGWKNNANEDLSADVKKFSTEVDRISKILPQSGSDKNPPLVGIYLAWRGLTLTVEPFKTISYWPRRAVARRVGRTGIYDAVEQIVNKVGEARSRTTLVFVGHSFGARVLENAADAAGGKPGFMNRHLQVMKQRQLARRRSPMTMELKEAPQPPADLIVYVNAATASTVTRRTVKEWEAICKEGSDSAVCAAHPFWLAFTSTADVATGVIMPIANAVFPALSSDGLHLISAANTPWLHTHDVHEETCEKNRKPDDFNCPPGSKADACFGAIRDASKYCYEIRRVNPTEPVKTFWIMNVNGHVVKDHGDIWNANVINLILSIMRKQRGTVNLFREQLLKEDEKKARPQPGVIPEEH